MTTTIRHNNRNYTIDFSKPLDISIPISGKKQNVVAWGVDLPEIGPHISGDYEGSVAAGQAVNFNDIKFNPHAHGTHTECYGHITKEVHSVNKVFSKYFFKAEVITIAPEKYQDDFVISKKQLQYAIGNKKREAIIIRTLPNTAQKKRKHYSNSNPAYLLEEAAKFLAEIGVDHLLIDLPSVDREKDFGALLAHRAFWNMGGSVRKRATITELIFVNNEILDGTYFLSLQLGPFENDAAPSRPVLYAIQE